jgi:hypothetical protein
VEVGEDRLAVAQRPMGGLLAVDPQHVECKERHGRPLGFAGVPPPADRPKVESAASCSDELAVEDHPPAVEGVSHAGQLRERGGGVTAAPGVNRHAAIDGE